MVSGRDRVGRAGYFCEVPRVFARMQAFSELMKRCVWKVFLIKMGKKKNKPNPNIHVCWKLQETCASILKSMASWTAIAQIATSIKTAKACLISLGDARRKFLIILSMDYFIQV